MILSPKSKTMNYYRSSMIRTVNISIQILKVKVLVWPFWAIQPFSHPLTLGVLSSDLFCICMKLNLRAWKKWNIMNSIVLSIEPIYLICVIECWSELWCSVHARNLQPKNIFVDFVVLCFILIVCKIMYNKLIMRHFLKVYFSVKWVFIQHIFIC